MRNKYFSENFSEYLPENLGENLSNRLRGARRLAARFAVGAVFAATFVLSVQPASAQLAAYDESCYFIRVDPHRFYLDVGERTDLDLWISTKENCLPVAVERWTFSATDDRLLTMLDPAPEKELGLLALDGAISLSYVTIEAELISRLDREPVATIQRRIIVRVSEGVRLTDLRVNFVAAAPHAVAGRDFTAAAEVFNGDVATDVGFYSTFRLDGNERSAFCPPLERLTTCTQDFTLPAPLEEGLYTYTFCADASDVIRESSEIDNCVTGTVRVGPEAVVDLAADGLVISPDVTRVGQPTQVTAVSRNIGGEPSGPFTLTVETPDGLFSETCPGLEPLATCSHTFAWEPTETGLQTLRFQIEDPNGEDANPLNNWTARNVEVAPGLPRPDLTVLAGGISMTPAAPQVGDDVSFEIVITNIGASWTIAQSGYAVHSVDLPGMARLSRCHPYFTLPAGGTCSIRFNWTMTEAGPQTLTVELDTSRNIDEVNEQNNYSTLQFVVGEADSDVTCQGNWSLIGTGTTTFNTTSPGSVVNGCDVYFGQNVPAGCWRTVGDGDLQATWHRASGSNCPTSATVTESQPPYQTWTFDVFIH